MYTTETEVDRYLTLLGNLIRQQGFTQLDVQRQLGWGRSYISQLVTRQKSLRVEQVLAILQVIGVPPQTFFGELYSIPRPYPSPSPFPPPRAASARHPQLEGIQALLRALVKQLAEKGLITADELEAAARAAEAERHGP